MAEMPMGPPRISGRFPVFDGGKPHAMGACAYGVREIEILSTVGREVLGSGDPILLGNSRIDSWSRDYLLPGLR
jgi:hypothetical protein